MSKVDHKLISQADYARHRGCSREAVRRAIEGERITAFGPDKMIDVALADAQWLRNTRARASSTAPAPAASSAASPAPPAATAPASASYADWRCRREAAEAQAAELRLAEERGELVRTADLRIALGRHLSAARDLALGVGPRLSALLLNQADLVHVQNLIDGEMHRFLAMLSGCGDAIPAQAPAPGFLSPEDADDDEPEVAG